MRLAVRMPASLRRSPCRHRRTLREKGVPELEVRSEGCIFCDVSRDKGYHGTVERDRVVVSDRRIA